MGEPTNQNESMKRQWSEWREVVEQAKARGWIRMPQPAKPKVIDVDWATPALIQDSSHVVLPIDNVAKTFGD